MVIWDVPETRDYCCVLCNMIRPISPEHIRPTRSDLTTTVRRAGYPQRYELQARTSIDRQTLLLVTFCDVCWYDG